jgi:hypothetical protein
MASLLRSPIGIWGAQIQEDQNLILKTQGVHLRQLYTRADKARPREGRVHWSCGGMVKVG